MPPPPGPVRWLLRRRLRRVLRLRDALQLGDLGERNLFLVARHRRLRLQHHDPPHGTGHLPGTPTTTQPVIWIRNILVRIQIRIRGSVRTNSFLQWLSRWQTIVKIFFYNLPYVYLKKVFSFTLGRLVFIYR